MGFTPEMQGFFNICKSINVIHHINILKDKNHMIFSIEVEFLKKNATSINDKNSPESRHKAIYDKLTSNTILNSEKLKAFSLRSRTRQGCPLLPLLFNTVLEIL